LAERSEKITLSLAVQSQTQPAWIPISQTLIENRENEHKSKREDKPPEYDANYLAEY